MRSQGSTEKDHRNSFSDANELMHFGRRTAFSAFTAALLAPLSPPLPAAAVFGDVQSVLSALPQGSRDWQRVGFLEEKLRPKVRALPRRRMDMDFAVLLMRTSYQVADDLDFMPMDEFQKDMFLLRQNEWDAYREKLNVKQGDLADPNYFDFMSFVQYATIANGMRNGRLVFNELIDANGTSTFVSRAVSNPSLISNSALPSAHAERVGERILEWVDERFPSISPKVPKGAPTAADLLDGVQQLAAIFQIEEYMLASNVAPLDGGGGLAWTLVAPATLWSSQVLAVRGDTPVNDFAAKAALAYLRRCGVPATVVTRIDKNTQVTHELRWNAGFVML